MVAIYH